MKDVINDSQQPTEQTSDLGLDIVATIEVSAHDNPFSADKPVSSGDGRELVYSLWLSVTITERATGFSQEWYITDWKIDTQLAGRALPTSACEPFLFSTKRRGGPRCGRIAFLPLGTTNRGDDEDFPDSVAPPGTDWLPGCLLRPNIDRFIAWMAEDYAKDQNWLDESGRPHPEAESRLSSFTDALHKAFRNCKKRPCVRFCGQARRISAMAVSYRTERGKGLPE